VIDAHNNWRSRFLSWRLGGAHARLGKYYRERLALIVWKRPGAIPTILEQYAALARAAGMPPAPARPGGIEVPAAVRTRLDDALPATGDMIAVAPGSRWDTKRWSRERFLELARALVDTHGFHVVLVGDESDAGVARPIADELDRACTNVTGRRSVVETAAWIERCRAFVGNDSGLTHLAEALGVPVVAVFGPTVREFGYFPALEASRTVERALDCRPCSRNGARPCPRDRQVCLDIDVAAVESAVLEALDGTGDRHHVLT
jgi:ADP-heptose:LPS heptosyltransferase